MSIQPKNLGVWERVIVSRLCLIWASILCMTVGLFRWRVYTEESNGEISFVGIISGSLIDDNLKFVKSLYGNTIMDAFEVSDDQFKFYRIAYDYDEGGWCVYEEKNRELYLKHGPFSREEWAREKMNQLHRDQGFDI